MDNLNDIPNVKSISAEQMKSMVPTWTVNVPVGCCYRLPMNATTIAEDEAQYAENARRAAAGEELLPPLPKLEYKSNKRFYLSSRTAPETTN